MLARNELGDVKVWNSSQSLLTTDVAAASRDVTTNAFTDLIVLGEPKAIVSKMVTELAFDRGFFEAPIAMTIAYGLNWAHHWLTGAFFSEKSVMIERLHKIRTRFFTLGRGHPIVYSPLLNELLCAIDQTIKTRDWPSFVVAVERLDEHSSLSDMRKETTPNQ